MAVLFAFAWFGGIVAAVVFLIRPKRNWPPVATRARAALMLVALLVVPPLLLKALAPDFANQMEKRGERDAASWSKP